ncbi:MAG TPA: isoleucine--tRNA ligase [Candidatus Baltobacteraceae bacterium]|nr:isoleucine--tRNA ligase [Candidatus Baltobacteraceae bacterium]
MSENTVARDYRQTLNLPKTEFPMKADLPKREPDRVRWWKEHRTYERRLEHNALNGPWILHDGPPYANNEPHMGGFFNMVLKDMFVKIALLGGKYAKFVPGWDMHGLPIELETLKHLGIKDFHDIDPLELRRQCEERALYWLDKQREIRIRMGNFGLWDRPYRTIDPSFEATIVNALADLAEKQQIYKGLRSTLWCVHDETALAEAEIEYETKKSPSIYVRFTANDEQRRALIDAFGARESAKLSFLIWTTTPWTLPANVAIALRPDATYGLYRVGHELLVLATALAPQALGERFADAKLVAQTTGKQLDGQAVRHPFMDRDTAIVLADYVDLETGTGAVHTAPGHGADDFDTGVKYNLPILNPVDARGHFTSEAGPYAGQFIFKANNAIVRDLEASGALWSHGEIEHSYPHCWRCHNPVIFRATAQWFIAMDQNLLRQRAVDAIDEVEFSPRWGKTRQRQMIETHPEWCISRQRTWGTPIPAIVCVKCGESLLDPRVARLAAKRFAEVGASVWWSDPVRTYLPDGFACPSCGGTEFEKEKNIVDIWFESGVTHLAVLGREDLPWPSDMVLEGADQYRGWFRSSLITGVATKGRAPYKHVVTHGWVNDEQGRAMSKSLGTGIGAREAMEKWGADVLRLWTASVEFFDDVRFGPNVIDQIGRVYRNLRNRIRFMLSNLEDLTPGDVIERDAMEPIDRLACNVTDLFVTGVKRSYDRTGLHDAYLQIVDFESAMSGLYFDALKDPLYSRASNDPRRRSAQSALLYVLTSFLTAIAPVLSFTAEEAWQSLPEVLRGDAESIFDTSFRTAAKPEGLEADLALWNELRKLRARVAASESPRDFEAKLRLGVSRPLYGELAELGDNLREALVVSQLELAEVHPWDGVAGIVTFDLTKADGQKCQRCWKFRELGIDPEHPDICADCAAVVSHARA